MFEINPTAVYTAKELAVVAEVDYTTVLNWSKNCGLVARKTGRHTYITGKCALEFFGSEAQEEIDTKISAKISRIGK